MNASLRDRLVASLSPACSPRFHWAIRSRVRGPARLAPLTLILMLLGALGVPLLACAAGGATTSPSGKITYSVHTMPFSIPSPDAEKFVHQSIIASCAQGEYALAGGYSMGSPPVIDDWQAAHPAPTAAKPDQYGLYRPIPKLLRVTASRPARDAVGNPVGWEIVIDGTVYPGSNTRVVAAYASCAPGLSAPPKTSTKLIDTSGGVVQTEAMCPAGTLVSGGGYTAGVFNMGALTGHLPVYISFLHPGVSDPGGWIVSTASFGGMYLPYPPTGPLEANAVCVSAQDFTQVSSSEVVSTGMPVRTDTWTATVVGQDTDYFYRWEGHQTCPAGAFPLPPGYDIDAATFGNPVVEIRVDQAMISPALDKWYVTASFGGAATYPSNFTSPQGGYNLYVYTSCLTPK